MGCSNSPGVEEISDEKKRDNESHDDKKSNKSENSDEKEEEKDKIEKEKELNDDDSHALSTEQNKSNINSERLQSDIRKISLHKQNYEGVTLMKGVEESIPPNLSEEDIYQLVKEAINYRITDSKDKIKKAQIKAIASILYNKIQRNEGKKSNSNKTDLNNYPELKGMNIKIGAEKLTKDIIRNMMFQNKKVDECQIDLTYANLTRENDDIKALTIEINT